MLSIILLITERNTNSIPCASISSVCCPSVCRRVCKKSSVSRLAQQAQAEFLLLQLGRSTGVQTRAKYAIFKFTCHKKNENALVVLNV